MNYKNQLVIAGGSSSIREAWANRQQQLNRNKVPLPDLTAVIDPKHKHNSHIIKRMRRFDMNRGGFSANTVKALSSALRKWRDYCLSQQVYAFPLNDDSHVELFLQALVLSEYSISTIQQYRSLLSSFYDYLGINNPASTRDVTAFMKSLKEDHIDLTGNAYSQKQASALRRHHLELLYHLNDTQPIDRHYFHHVRDIAFIAMAYGTCLRMSEIRHIKKRHIKTESDGLKVRVLRTRSKTSTSVQAKVIEGEEAKRFLAYFKRVEDRFNDEDYIFSYITSSYKTIRAGTPLSDTVTIEIFKRQCQRLRESGHIDPYFPVWSGHSCRIGRIQDGKEFDHLSDMELQRLGEWTTMRMVSTYLRGLIDGE